MNRVARALPKSSAAVLDAVAERLAEDPEHVLPALRALADPDAPVESLDDTSRGRVLALNAGRVRDRLATFRQGAYPTSHVRELLGGVSRQAVSQRVAARRLLAAEIGGTFYFPDWQFGDAGPLPGLPRVLAVLIAATADPIGADAVMRERLAEEDGRSPADLLAAGEVDKAAHYAGVAGGGL